MPGDLFENQGGRRFGSVGAAMGTGYSGDGRPQAGMGVDWGDFDRDGRMDLFVTTFALERKSLYHNEGASGFREMSDEAGLAAAIPYVAWGTRWVDIDNDGRLDCVVANGHALDNMGLVDPAQPYAQPTQLFHREGGLFREIGATICPALARPIAGRGVAVGDFDNDGRADLLITNGEGEPLLLHNESVTGGHWLRVTLVGRRSNRDSIGARVWLTMPDGTQVRDVTTGGSYLSASDPRLLFGLGSATRVTKLRVRWPGGASTARADLAADREVKLAEP
jgi:enediyne biosynthesis protein E4